MASRPCEASSFGRVVHAQHPTLPNYCIIVDKEKKEGGGGERGWQRQ